MQNEQEKIEHELVAKRFYILQDENVPEIQDLHSVPTAIPLCNVVDWEGVTDDWHEEAPVSEMTAVIMPYETKFVHIPFKQFHNIMRRYRANGRAQTRWSKLN